MVQKGFLRIHPWGLKEVNRKLLTLMSAGSKAYFEIQEATSGFPMEAINIDVSRKWRFLFKKGVSSKKQREKRTIFNFLILFPFFFSPLSSLSNIPKFSIFFQVHVHYFLVTTARSRSRRSSLVAQVLPACNLLALTYILGRVLGS